MGCCGSFIKPSNPKKEEEKNAEENKHPTTHKDIEIEKEEANENTATAPEGQSAEVKPAGR